MRRLLKLSLQKPELAAALLLLILIMLFQIKSNGVFISIANMRGVVVLLPKGIDMCLHLFFTTDRKGITQMAATQHAILRGGRVYDGAIGRQSGYRIHHNTENRNAVGVSVVV